MAIPNLSYVLLFVSNPIESGVFYSRILGILPVEEGPTFVLFLLPNGMKLGLWSSKTAEPKVTALPGSSEICFCEEDVDAAFMRLQKMGVEMAQVPTTMDFGRTFVALDPDGHRIRILRLQEQV